MVKKISVHPNVSRVHELQSPTMPDPTAAMSLRVGGMSHQRVLVHQLIADCAFENKYPSEPTITGCFKWFLRSVCDPLNPGEPQLASCPVPKLSHVQTHTHTRATTAQGDTKRDRKSSKGQWVRSVTSSTCNPSRCFSLCCAGPLSSLSSYRHTHFKCMTSYKIAPAQCPRFYPAPSSPFQPFSVYVCERENVLRHMFPFSFCPLLTFIKALQVKELLRTSVKFMMMRAAPFTSCTSPGLIKSAKP